MLDTIRKHRRLYSTYNNSFFKIFNIALSSYFDDVMGFDIVKFDEDIIKSPDNVSMADCVKDKYGQDGYDLLVLLL